MTIDFDFRVQPPENIQELIETAVAATLRMQGETDRIQIGFVLTDDTDIREINRELRNTDMATDVLSFPMLDYEGEEDDDISLNPEDFAGDVDPETNELLLGDIIVSLDRARVQAEDFGHSLEREIGYLTVHAMLHLLGYDHMTEEDRRSMRRREEAVLGSLNLTRD